MACSLKISLKSLYLDPFPRKMHFSILRRNSKWPPKVAGKQILGKVVNRLWIYPADQKFCRNRSIALRLGDKLVLAFYAEIQDGRQNWLENYFWKKYTLHIPYG